MKRLAGKIVALSTSEADDLATRGLSPLHQRNLVVDLAGQLFALEARIAYGGDFRKDGYTELLVVVQRAHARLTGTAAPSIASYLFEPLPAGMRAEYADAIRFVDVKFFDVERLADHSAAARARSQAMNLRAMRSEIARDVVALVAVGGRASRYTGWRPGIAEEIASAVTAGKPVYLVGGFGGAAGCYAEAAYLGGEIPSAPAPPQLEEETTGGLALPSAYEVVEALRGQRLRNGLTKSENARLASAVDPDEIVVLVLTGLANIST